MSVFLLEIIKISGRFFFIGMLSRCHNSTIRWPKEKQEEETWDTVIMGFKRA